MTGNGITLYRDERDRWGLAHGDALDLLGRLPAHSVDAVITDPPYGIGFLGQKWDRPTGSLGPAQAFEDFSRTWATECRRVLKPGGHLLAFGAPRMFHRLGVGIEDARFEIRDTLMWICGQGVPKVRRLPGGFSTTLKPGYEPILLARAPLTGSTGETFHDFGTGMLSVGESGSRWPGNLVLSHAPWCGPAGCVRDCPSRLLDEARPDVLPSRFLYAAKTSRREREAGCENLPPRQSRIFSSTSEGSPKPRRNVHPTVKPIELMRWLVRLSVPSGGVVLDPFAGSGSTGIAAALEGRGFLGIEREDDYVEIAVARLGHWSNPEISS